MPRNPMGVPAIKDAFYWIGVTTTMACFALVLARNTELIWRFEHAGIPLSWLAGVVAILAFLGAEYSDSTPTTPTETEPSPEALQQEV